MRNSIEAYHEFRRRPAMYTGENTLDSISRFLAGYAFAIFQYEVPSENDPFLISREFHDWVAYRLHFYESTSGWCGMITSKSDSDGAAVDRFFELLDEFRRRVPHTVARVSGIEKSFRRMLTEKDAHGLPLERTEILPYPKSIVLVTYTNDPGFFLCSETNEEFPFDGFCPDLHAFELRTGIRRDQLILLDPEWNYSCGQES